MIAIQILSISQEAMQILPNISRSKGNQKQWKIGWSDAVYDGGHVDPKNHYHQAFLAYIWFALKRNHVVLYQFDCIIKLKYHLYRPVLKYNLFARHLNYYKKMFTSFSPSIRMIGGNIIFNDKKIKQSKFYKSKKPSKLDEIDADKILVSKRESYGKKGSLKYFIGYNEDDVIRPLCIKLPQMIGYVKYVEILFC